MSDTNIKWYSMNPKLAVEEHDPIELDEALKLVDRYLARGSEKFKTAEEAIAATMFGFSRSKSEFIEICVNGPAQISYKFEVSDSDASWFCKLFKGVFRREEELHSREELVQKVEEFFTTPVQEIKRRFESR
jgi:hypothetical protein